MSKKHIYITPRQEHWGDDVTSVTMIADEKCTKCRGDMEMEVDPETGHGSGGVVEA